MLLKIITIKSGIEKFIPCPMGFTFQPETPNDENVATFCIKTGHKVWDEIHVIKGEQIAYLENDKGETVEKFQWNINKEGKAYRI